MKKILFNLILLISFNIYSQGDAGVNLNPSNEIKFISDDDMKYEREPLALPPLPTANKANSFFDLANKVSNSKISLQDFSDVKFKDVYKRNEDGTYSPKSENFSNNEEGISADYTSESNNYTYNNYSENKSSLDEESFYLMLIIVVIVIFLLISEFFGRAKHIGRWWTFFLLLCGLIPGLIAVIVSPSAKRSPTQGGKSHIIWAWIFLVFGILNIISLYHSEGKSGHLFYAFFILSLYLFELSKGLVINRNPKFYFDSKNINNHAEIKHSHKDYDVTSTDNTKEKDLFKKVLKFLKNDDKITLEIEFCDFKSSIYEGMTAINLPTKLNRLNVYIIKSPILGRITFFFRDSPKFVFSLTVDEEDLFNNINNNEIVLENFIALAAEPIKGNKLTISNNMLSVNAIVINHKTLIGGSHLAQYYFDATSFKSYDYQLDFKTLTETPKKTKTLTKTTNIKNKPINQKVIVSDNKKNHSVYYVLIAFAIVIGLNIYNTSKTNTDNSINTEQYPNENLTPIDTTAAAVDSVATIEPNEVSVDSTTATIENNSNNDSQITNSFFLGTWHGGDNVELTFYSDGSLYIKLIKEEDGFWTNWKYEDNIIYLNKDKIQKLYIYDMQTNSISCQLEGTSNILYMHRDIRL